MTIHRIDDSRTASVATSSAGQSPRVTVIASEARAASDGRTLRQSLAPAVQREDGGHEAQGFGDHLSPPLGVSQMPHRMHPPVGAGASNENCLPPRSVRDHATTASIPTGNARECAT